MVLDQMFFLISPVKIIILAKYVNGNTKYNMKLSQFWTILYSDISLNSLTFEVKYYEINHKTNEHLTCLIGNV